MDSGRRVQLASQPDLASADRIDDADEVARVLGYLRGGTAVATFFRDTVDRIEPERGRVVPMEFRTDGAWVWPAAVAYYLEVYGIAPEPALLAHIKAQGYVAAVPDAEAQRAALAALDAAGSA
jgi:hypothetical protein